MLPAGHGGDLAAAERRWGSPPAGWLDLSTGINPFPYPLAALPAECWTRLPQSDDEAALRAAAASAWGVADPDRIVTAPGSQAIIQILPRLFPKAGIAILGPTYSGHEQAWAEAGHAVRAVAGLSAAGDAAILVVTHPNNPDGREIPPDRLRERAARLAARGGMLVLDEAFRELRPELSLAGTDMPGLLVLRSFGKFFGLAGVRLGFAVAEAATAESLRRALGPWPVSGPALAIGRTALSDRAWSEATRLRLGGEFARLDRLLESSGLRIVGGTALFRLTESPRAGELWDHLGRLGILVRAFADHPAWLRFGLPPGEPGRERLAAALASF